MTCDQDQVGSLIKKFQLDLICKKKSHEHLYDKSFCCSKNRKTSTGSLASGSDSADSVKTAGKTVNVEFICPDLKEDEAEAGGHLTDGDLSVLEHAATAIRLAARIVDTPCNEMHTDAFIQEVLFSAHLVFGGS